MTRIDEKKPWDGAGDRMKARNLKNDKELSNNVNVADGLLKRMKGLLGRNELTHGEALWIKPCMSIHTFFMNFPIDVVFLNKRNQVTVAIKNLQPNRMTRLYPKAASVLELPAGIIEATATEVGDGIEIA
jgi:uncharacterized membrane protein (UPF0127 family)